MTDKVYNADSRLLAGSFRLTDSKIIVSPGVGKSEWWFDLGDLKPTPERIRKRFPVLMCIPSCLAVVLAWATWVIAERYPVYTEPVLLFGGAATLGVLFHVYREILPVEFARFRTKAGKTAFDIAKGDRQSLAFEHFVEALQKSISSQPEAKN